MTLPCRWKRFLPKLAATLFEPRDRRQRHQDRASVIIWDVQYHPYKKEFCHIDYYGVDLNQLITVEVPVEFVGTRARREAWRPA